MTVIVHIADADLRDMPFPEYAVVLGHLMGERYLPGDYVILPGDRTEVVVADPSGPGVADEVPAMSRDITRPEFVDGYFG